MQRKLSDRLAWLLYLLLVSACMYTLHVNW
jgi:hypothetical protein